MAHGFIVLDENCIFDQDYRDEYLELREKLFNLAKECPQWRIFKGMDSDLKVPKIELQNANIGFVETLENAELLKNKLKKIFPSKTLKIYLQENKQATELSFYYTQ